MKKSPRKKPPAFKIASREETLTHDQRQGLPSAEPVTSRQLRLDREKRQRQIAAAAAATHPGPLRQAFASFPTQLLGCTLVPVCLGHVSILQAIDSPFLRAMRLASLHFRAKTKAEKNRIAKTAISIKTDVQSIGECFFVFTHTYDDLAALMSQGRDAFKDAATAFWSALPPTADIERIDDALAAHYMASYATALAFQSRKDPRDSTINFQTPGRKTASANG